MTTTEPTLATSDEARAKQQAATPTAGADAGIPRGLTDAEADAIRAAGHGHHVKQETSRTFKQIVRDNLFTFINITLIAVGIILIVLGQYRDALMASGLAVLNACVGIFQEARAKRRLDQIALLTRPTAFVVRDGQVREVPPDQLVLGDILVTRPGDQIMLDGHVVSGEMDVDESLLTGETDLIHKVPGDQVFSGTYCVNGAAYFKADKVGADTMASSITAGARAFKRSLTPVQRDVNMIVKVLLAIAIFLLSMELLGSLIWATPFNETVVGAAVILGIVPSGLFLMITVTYSMGAVRLAHEDALVQQMNAVESLSHVNVFCADKTGTLTANRLKLSALQPIGIDENELRTIAGCLAASASAGNKTSDAIAAACPVEKQELVDEVPFSSARKWSALSVESDVVTGTIALGAPEMLGPLLTYHRELEPPEGWADEGLRVLIVAFSPKPVSLHDTDGNPVLPSDIKPIGWLGFSDELRPNLRETLEGFRRTKVDLKIISGDNPDTVAALARQAGFGGDAKLVSGLELAEMSDAEFDQAADEGTIFGRITPEQKERLVDALRRQGHYVAMTGDGVNDVLSLKKANLGIAMQSGSQATRAAADIILLNDSFAAVPAAFREGQRIRRGLQDILNLFLVRVFSVALILIAVIFVRGGFPFSPANMTLLTMLTVGIPTFALALYAHPGRASERIIMPLVQFVLPATILLFITAFSVYVLFYFLNDVDLDQLRAGEVAGRTAGTEPGALARDALTYVMILSGLWLVVFVAPPNKWWAVVEETDHDWRPTLVALAMIPLYIVILTVPWLRELFSVRLLSIRDYVIIAVAVTLWAFALRYIWKAQVFERFFGYSAPYRWEPDPDRSDRAAPAEKHQTASLAKQ